jgi:hypothetical protein
VIIVLFTLLQRWVLREKKVSRRRQLAYSPETAARAESKRAAQATGGGSR